MRAVQVDLHLRQALSHATNQTHLAECTAVVVFRSNSLPAVQARQGVIEHLLHLESCVGAYDGQSPCTCCL